MQAEEPQRARSYASLSDLPGIGATKADWLVEAGMTDVDAVRRASIDDLAHVRGVGYVLAGRIKEVLTGTELTDAQRQWQERTASLRSEIRGKTAELLAHPERRSLKPKLVKQLERVLSLLDDVPVDHPPEDDAQREKISKHEKALASLIEGASELESGDKNYQKVLRNRISTRRKKLDNWL